MILRETNETSGTTDTADIAIVGGGFTGMALAHRLANGQRNIVVYEARQTPARRFAGELLQPGRLSVLGAPLLARLRKLGAPIYGFAIMRRPDEPATLLPYDAERGGLGLGIEHAVLVEELRRSAAECPGVTVRYGARAEVAFAASDIAVGVQAEDGHRTHAPLTLSAEGRHSRLRSRLGFPTESRLVSFTAALRLSDATLPHPGFGHVFLGAPGPILAYPISERDVRVCFDLPAGDHAEATLRPRLVSDYLPFVPDPLRGAIAAAMENGDVQLVANHAIRTERCVAPGVGLVGDAGGCAHPLTAAGMSVCLNDIELLAQEIDLCDVTGEPIDVALDRFEAQRYRFVRVRETLTDALYRLFEHAGASGEALRDALFAHWKVAREESLELLACQSSSSAQLQREWGKVALRAIGGVLLGESGPRLPALYDLARFAATQLPKLRDVRAVDAARRAS